MLAERSSVSQARSVCVYGMAELISSLHFRLELLAPPNFSRESTRSTGIANRDEPSIITDYAFFGWKFNYDVSSFSSRIEFTNKFTEFCSNCPDLVPCVFWTPGCRLARPDRLQAHATSKLQWRHPDRFRVQDARLQHAHPRGLLSELSHQTPCG